MNIIKSYKLFESKESVEDICSEYGIENWTLNDDGSIDVDDNVHLRHFVLKKLPLKFGKVTGNFDCSENYLTSLEGSPNWVGGDFDCSDNNLTSLIGGPNFVDGDFWCRRNELTSLEGCPEKIFGNLDCHTNDIITLDYYPTILAGQLLMVTSWITWIASSGNPISEIWDHLVRHKRNNHGYYLLLFQLHDPIRFEGGEWVCYRELLDNFFEEIGVLKPPKLKNYKEV